MKRCFSRRPLWILILEYRPRVVSGNATFKAGSLVRLQPGFQAATGTTFSACIESVPPPAASRFYYLKDHLGSIRAIVNGSGTVDSYKDYYPFGMVMEQRSGSGTADKRFEFTGYEKNTQTGTLHAGQREYLSTEGKFNRVDRFDYRFAGLSPYMYAGGNPITFVDQRGDSVIVSNQMNSSEELLRYLKSEVGFRHVSQFAHAGGTVTVQGVTFTFSVDGPLSKQNLVFADESNEDFSWVVPLHNEDLKYTWDFVNTGSGVQEYYIYISSRSEYKSFAVWEEVVHALMYASGKYEGYTTSATILKQHKEMIDPLSPFSRDRALFSKQGGTDLNEYQTRHHLQQRTKKKTP